VINAELAHLCENELGEGIIWSSAENAILWTDILGKQFWRFDPLTRKATAQSLSERLCCFASLGEGRLLAGFASGLALYDLNSVQRELIAVLESDQPTTRLNDGKLDRQGRLVFGTMDEGPEGPKPLGHVWSYDGKTPPRILFSGVKISNSICFSPDGRLMYFADTPARRIDVFDYDGATGSPSNRRVFVELKNDAGYPDGSAIDTDGCLWNAEWDGGRVVRYDPKGRIVRVISLPVPNVTCCAFGGPKLRDLYITTARVGLTPEALAVAPLSGSLFVVPDAAQGLADKPFGV
jgi:L-arabinonolactonase